MTTVSLDPGARICALASVPDGAPPWASLATATFDVNPNGAKPQDIDVAPAVAWALEALRAAEARVLVIEFRAWHMIPALTLAANQAIQANHAVMGRMVDRLEVACPALGIATVRLDPQTWRSRIGALAKRDDSDGDDKRARTERRDAAVARALREHIGNDTMLRVLTSAREAFERGNTRGKWDPSHVNDAIGIALGYALGGAARTERGARSQVGRKYSEHRAEQKARTDKVSKARLRAARIAAGITVPAVPLEPRLRAALANGPLRLRDLESALGVTFGGALDPYLARGVIVRPARGVYALP